MSGKECRFEMMAVARERMEKHEVALSLLAQGQNSPYWTEDLAAEIEAAKVRLESTANRDKGARIRVLMTVAAKLPS